MFSASQDQNNLNLTLPEECKAELLELLHQFDLQMINTERKRDTVKRVLHRTAVDFGLTSAQSIDDEWERSIKFAESQSPVTIFDFWDFLTTAAKDNIKLNADGSSGGPEKQRKLSMAVYTALTKSLFTQFASEIDLVKCTRRLREAVPDPSLVNWKMIDTSEFVSRLSQEWPAMLPLMTNDFNDDYYLNTSLLLSMGMNVNDFTNAFFSQNDHNPEQDDTLRIVFQIDSISTNNILQELFGKIMYHDDNYLVTDPINKLDEYQYRVTSMKSPYQSRLCSGNQEQWDKINEGAIFKDGSFEFHLSEANEKENEHDYSGTLNLYIPEKFKQQIFELFEKHYQHHAMEKLSHERKRDVVKQIFYRTAVDFGLTSSSDNMRSLNLASEWERYIKIAESKSSITIFDFWEHLTHAARNNFKIGWGGGWGAPEDERKLAFTVYTALTQSLFDQFADEKNLYKCTKRLHDAIKNHTVVDWKQIDMRGFPERLMNDWHAFRPLMYDNCLSSYFSSTGLLKGVGFDISDFTNAFFSSKQLSSQEIAGSFFPSDIITHIARFCSGEGLHTFRQLSRSYYNAVEKDDILRINHRQFVISHLISKDYILQELIGKVLFSSNDYLLTDPTTKHSDYNYRITSMKNPYQSVSYFGNQGQWDKIIGGYVFKDDNGKLNILTAYRCEVYPGEFTVQRLQIDSLVKLTEYQHFKTVKVTHNGKSVINNYNAPIWDREAKINVNKDEVTVDVKFTQGIDKSYRNFSFFGPVERYQAKFNLTDFDAEIEKSVAVMKNVAQENVWQGGRSPARPPSTLNPETATKYHPTPPNYGNE